MKESSVLILNVVLNIFYIFPILIILQLSKLGETSSHPSFHLILQQRNQTKKWPKIVPMTPEVP